VAMEIILASSNNHKLQEIRKILPKSCILLPMKEVGISDDIEETGSTFHENALIKAQHIYDLTNKSSLADDSGLEVYYLNNEPGVFSARYAGEPSNTENNIDKLLFNLTGIEKRMARFVTVLCFFSEKGSINYFEGEVKGKITFERKGTNGFGYDPVFIPDGYTKTFAEMTDEEKNSTSHRAVALRKFKAFLKLQRNNDKG